MAQLTLDGGEENPAGAVGRKAASFSRAQREILRLARENGGIKPYEAGEIVHAHRSPPCRRCASGDCPYTSSDGVDALKRLAKRNVVERAAHGWYVLPTREH